MYARFTDRVRQALATGAPLPLIRGGDGTTEPPEMPRDADGNVTFADLTDEQVGTLHTELLGWYNTARASATAADADILEAAVRFIVALREEADARINGPARLEAQLAGLDDLLTVADPEPEPTIEAEPTPDATPVVAAAPPARVAVTAEPVPPLPNNAPVTAAGERLVIRPTTTITAAGDVPGFATGEELSGIRQISEALISKREAIGRPGNMRGSELVSVARLRADWPEDRHLRAGDVNGNAEKINAVVGPEALVASGGICAPVTPYYDMMVLSESMRPVRDALPGFNADRGGIRFVTPPKLSDASGAAGLITAAQDLAALGGNSTQIAAATKPAVHATCGTVTEVDVSAVTRILEFGNMTTRAFPEQVDTWVALAMAQQARKADVALLDGLSTNSTQVTQAQVGTSLGVARELVALIAKAGSYYRQHNRMSPDRVLRCLLPAFAIDMAIADLAHGSGYEMEFFSQCRAQVTAALAELGINLTLYVDSGTGKGQYFNSGNALTNGAIGTFPTTIVYYLFAEGSFLFIDGGTLDLGIVRDSSLNAVNNYRMFAESFENIAYVGVESLEITLTTVASGGYAPAASAITSY